ncbi:hypothetical protein V492_00756 [Pseudogymnoascus sp. VKM F-4246]|nr:hypothetical protein V492_00756 [Pseudogymnoascus sp. VKM F-4246]
MFRVGALRIVFEHVRALLIWLTTLPQELSVSTNPQTSTHTARKKRDLENTYVGAVKLRFTLGIIGTTRAEWEDGLKAIPLSGSLSTSPDLARRIANPNLICSLAEQLGRVDGRVSHWRWHLGGLGG